MAMAVRAVRIDKTLYFNIFFFFRLALPGTRILAIATFAQVFIEYN